jgi:hypothetical protein
MIHVIDMICKILAGCSVVLMALSFMYVCIVIIFEHHTPGPPPTMFMGLFGIFAAGLLYAGTHLLVGDLL